MLDGRGGDEQTRMTKEIEDRPGQPRPLTSGRGLLLRSVGVGGEGDALPDGRKP